MRKSRRIVISLYSRAARASDSAAPGQLDGRQGEGLVLKPGMTFTIEPMINEGTRHTKLLPDGWTVVTKDRKLSAQWEHTVVVTDDGVEILTRVPGDDNDL